MLEIKLEITEGVVAWYGAIVASLSFVFSAYNIWRDSSRISIEFEEGLFLSNAEPLYKSDVEYLGVTVVNKGRRPIRITSARFLILGNEKQLFLTDSLANHRVQVLTEENPKTQFLVEKSSIETEKIWCIVVFDATNRKYNKYTRKFPTFLRAWYFFKKKMN